ncbi:MAG: PAS-domain containing protein [Alphaproteobacteria bacterium]|nr:PAS-domain containing protein [Alphaproteobacteria bacterium]
MKRWLVLFSLIASPAHAQDSKALAAYPVVASCLLIVVLVLFLYDISRRKQREKLAQSTQALEEKNRQLQHLQAALDLLPVPFWQRDETMQIVRHNRAYGEAIEGSSLVGGKIPELDKKVPAQARQAKEAGKAATERRYVIIGGARKLYDVTEIPAPDGSMIGYALDVSEIDALKEDLARHNSAMDDFLESSASAMAIYGADMRLKSFNYAFVALWKLDEMWLGTHPTYGEILENLREKRKLPEQANFQLFKQQQVKLFRDLINPKEEFFYLPDGKALRVLAIPHALGGIMFAYEDVTDRLALERSYNTLIAVQRETLDNLHEGVAVFGEDGRLKLSNPNYVQLWHIPEEMAKSEPHVRDIVDKCKPLYVYEEWESFKQDHIRQLQARESHAQRLELADGTVIDWRKVPLPDGANLITYMDITDSMLVERSLRERNEALQEADKLKSQFLANVSYELRSPLTSIAGFSEMLSQEYFGTLSEKQREYVEGIHQSSQRLMQLINDILDLASIEAGYMRLEVAPLDVAELVKSVVSLIQERVREHKLKLKVECPAKIGQMIGDETRIKQILFNLLSNAIKYSESGDKITFGAKASDEGEVVIWVQDQGAGIPPEEQDAIFGTFYRGRVQDAAKNKSAKRSGTGLGLSIVKSFMELHGGRIELHSEPGKGTRFECIFLRDNPKLMVT